MYCGCTTDSSSLLFWYKFLKSEIFRSDSDIIFSTSSKVDKYSLSSDGVDCDVDCGVDSCTDTEIGAGAGACSCDIDDDGDGDDDDGDVDDDGDGDDNDDDDGDNTDDGEEAGV